MTQAVNYTVNYAGNFTALASAFAGIGTDLTYSASGVCTGGTASTITLASGTTAACIGHTLAWNGNRYLIGGFNAGSLVATIAALAGYPASFAGTPASGNSYTIDDVAVTLTIGQSAAGNNKWSLGATLNLAGVTTSATNTITLQGATPWNPGLPLTPNGTGLATQAVFLAGSVNYAALLIGSANNVIVNDLAFANTANGGVVSWGGAAVALNRVFIQANASQIPFYSGNSVVVAAKNCIFRGGGGGYVNSNGAFTGCLFLNLATGLSRNYGSPSASDCGFFGCATITSGATLTNCASDLAGTAGATQLGAASTQFVNATGDFRPLASGGLVGLGGANTGLASDIYGVTRNAAHVTVGAAETGYAPPATQSVTYAVNYAGDVTALTPAFLGSGAISGSVLTISAVTSGSIGIGDTILYANNAATPSGSSLYVTSFGTGSGGIGSYNLSGSDTSSATYPEIDVPALSRQLGSDLTYFQQGLSCPATGGGSAQIVLDPTTTTACLGHPIQWKSGAIGMITGLAIVGGNLVATIGAIAGYPANFGGVPQMGDAYTIFPTSVTFAIGQSAAGNRLYDLQQSPFGSGAIYLAAKTSATNTITLGGAYGFDPTVALGTITGAGSTSAVGIANHGDHRAVLQINSPALNVFVKGLQFWSKFSSETAAEDGCFVGSGGALFAGCLLRGDNYSDDGAHSPGLASVTDAVSMVNCVLIGNKYLTEILTFGNHWKFCTIVNTNNVVATLTAPAAAGATVLSVSSTAGIVSAQSNHTYNAGMFVGGPAGAFSNTSAPTLNAPGGSYATGVEVDSLTATSVTVNAATLAAMAVGTPLYFGASKGVGTTFTSLNIANCAVFGMALPVDASHGATITSSVTDVPAPAAGWSQVSYAGALIAASGTAGSGVDARTRAGSGMAIGTPDATVTTDIFGNTRSLTAPTVGAVELASETLTVVTPSSPQLAGATIAITGTYAAGTPAALDYSLDGGSWITAVSPTIGSGNYSLQATLPFSGTSHTIGVRDHNNTTAWASSGTFTLTNFPTITVAAPSGVVAGQGFIVSGGYSGVAPAAIGFTLDAAPLAVSALTIAAGAFSGHATAPAAAAHSIAATEAASGATGSSPSFAIGSGGGGGTAAWFRNMFVR